jgi:hypothetical protein
MTLPRKLHLLFVVCFFFCSVAVMYGQGSSFGEGVTGESEAGTNCQKNSTKKLAISCSGSWGVVDAEGSEIATAKNGFGHMRAYSYSEVTILVDHTDAYDSAPVSEVVQDYLSILGLNGEPTAFLKLEFVCVQCIKYNYPAAYYVAYLGTTGFCQIYGVGNSPRCTLNVPIVYNGNGQPNPVYLQRQLGVNAMTNVINGPAGATVETTVCIGDGGCGSIGATVTASVVNAKGKVFKRVTIVGASGHIYN